MINTHLQHLKRRGLAETTIDIRRRRIVALDHEVGLENATPEAVEAFLDARDLTTKTRYDWVSHLHNFYDWAVRWGWLDHNPTLMIVRPKVPQKKPRPIRTEDLILALEHATPTMQAWLYLGALAGLRCAEIAGLRMEDLMWHEGETGLLYVRGKGEKTRLVPMHPKVREALQVLPLPHRGPTFRRPHGGKYPAAQVSRDGNRYLAELEIPATMHQLRHWFGTNIYRACRDLRVTQELMGHSSPTTTAIYADWSRDEAYIAVAALDIDVQPSLLADWQVALGA